MSWQVSGGSLESKVGVSLFVWQAGLLTLSQVERTRLVRWVGMRCSLAVEDGLMGLIEWVGGSGFFRAGSS